MNRPEVLFTTGKGSLAEGGKGGSNVFARMFTIKGRVEQFGGFALAGQEKVMPALRRSGVWPVSKGCWFSPTAGAARYWW
jgi:hypothetical protein